jgi:acyl-CoA hydrolase
MIVGIRVEAQNVKLGTIKHTNSSYLTMVAKGDDDKPTQVPRLILETHDDVRRFIEALHMREIKSKVKEQLNDARAEVEIANAPEILRNERCVIHYQY